MEKFYFNVKITDRASGPPSLRWLDTVLLGSIPPKFEHKLHRHNQRFGKIATTVVLDKDEDLLRSGLQRHRSCHRNEMTLLPILLSAVYLGNGNFSSKVVQVSFFLQQPPRCS